MTIKSMSELNEVLANLESKIKTLEAHAVDTDEYIEETKKDNKSAFDRLCNTSEAEYHAIGYELLLLKDRNAKLEKVVEQQAKDIKKLQNQMQVQIVRSDNAANEIRAVARFMDEIKKHIEDLSYRIVNVEEDNVKDKHRVADHVSNTNNQLVQLRNRLGLVYDNIIDYESFNPSQEDTISALEERLMCDMEKLRWMIEVELGEASMRGSGGTEAPTVDLDGLIDPNESVIDFNSSGTVSPYPYIVSPEDILKDIAKAVSMVIAVGETPMPSNPQLRAIEESYLDAVDELIKTVAQYGLLND